MTYHYIFDYLRHIKPRWKRKPIDKPKPISNYYQDIEFNDYYQYVEWAPIHTGTHIPTRRQGGDIE